MIPVLKLSLSFFLFSWLRWARHENHLKVISAGVPTGVLPNGLEGEIIDVKVFTKRGPDDAIYDKNKEIRKRVRQVYCLHIKNFSIKERNA